jgi:hypothetical protein
LTGTLGAVAAFGLAACAASPDHSDGAMADVPPVAPLASVQVAPGLRIHPRSEWGADLPPRGAIAPEIVKFLLVHHIGSSNNVPDPRAVIRQTYAFHTGPAKRWPDICYHFMIGPDGSIWETRAGSLAGPPVADGTGGNQGDAQLVCLIGDFQTQRPTGGAGVADAHADPSRRPVPDRHRSGRHHDDRLGVHLT